MKPAVILNIENILGQTLHAAPTRGEDPVSGVMPFSERQPFRYALRNGKLAGLNLAGVKLTDVQWQQILQQPGFEVTRMEALNLRDNQLKASPLPEGMTNLRYLDLTGNQLEDFTWNRTTFPGFIFWKKNQT